MAQPPDKRTLTDATVRAFPLPSAGRRDIIDAITPGLILRVSATGRRTWLLRANGKRTVLGTYPSVTLAEARRAAAEMRDMEARPVTVEEAAERFLKAHAVHLRSGDQLTALLTRHVVPRIGSRAVASIGRADVAGLLRAVQGDDATRRVRITNRVRGALSRMMRWCVSEGLSPSNPAAQVEPRRGERKRDRVLTDEELRAVWLACEGWWPFGEIVKLLMLTGQRRDEVADLDWSELDWPASLWRIPAARMKSSRPHVVPLSEHAMVVLAAGRWHGRAFDRFTSWSRAKRKLDRLSGVSGWQLRDLRRTCATGMVRLGVARDVTAMVLGHIAAGATGRYIRENDVAAMREALELWGRHVEGVVAPRLL